MTTVRRGLPRTRGGEAWPPAGVVAAGATDAAAEVVATPPAGDRTPAEQPSSVVVERAPAEQSLPGVVERAPAQPERDETRSPAVLAGGDGVSSRAPAASSLDDPGATGSVLRRGLPRVVGGEPWPPAGTAAVVAASVLAAGATEGTAVAIAPTEAETALVRRPDVSAPLPFTRTVWNGSAPRHIPAAEETTRRATWPQAIGGLLGAAAVAVLAGAAIALVRAFLSLPFMQDFLAAFPGEYEPAVHVAPGFPAWVGWQHFFNVFLMTLIIRSGTQVRHEKRPTVFWTPRRNQKGKISLTLWFHQALDLIWIVNGVVFVVLLFVTDQWARIVPTSWAVFPNALSAALQYVSFDWPTENGWVNYNSLQQIAYFTIVFLAAPLAIVTGFRMSGLWPKKAERLSKAYPIEWARALHFPTMLFFVLFIVVHVALVLLTGMLRNLNHMYALQDAVTWTGFWVFLASLAVIAIGWIAARPLVLAPIAKIFGNVSRR